MRIALYFNPGAGSGVSLETLCRELERCEYEIASIVKKGMDPARLLDEPCPLVVAAGGDGTANRVVRALAGSGVPIALLPLGTANNVARTLGLERSIRNVIRGWRSSARVRVDLGLVRGRFGEMRFLEGIGVGLVPHGIASQEARAAVRNAPTPTAARRRALRGFAAMADAVKPRRVCLTVDGKRLDGEYLLVEVLNIRSVGPNIELSPDSDPSDGLLEVVTAGERQREQLALYLTRRARGMDDRLELPMLRARQVEIEGGGKLHVDDKLLSVGRSGTVSIRVERAAVELLAGPSFACPAASGAGDATRADVVRRIPRRRLVSLRLRRNSARRMRSPA